MTDESMLRDAITRFIRERPAQSLKPWAFTRRDVAILAEDTGARQEEIERAFFALCGTVWAGWVSIRNEHDRPYKNERMAPPSGWTGTVSLDTDLMQDWGTLPEHRP